MSNSLSREQKKKLAKELYLTGKHQQKDIAKMVDVAENTISRWVRDDKWELLRSNLTTTKENLIAQLYGQLAEINNNIENRDEGKRFAVGSEPDAIVKLSAAIRKMETETGIGEIISVSTGICEFVRKYDVEEAKRISEHFNAYIEYKMK